jgi:MFS transporter, DHA1 family, tetracycline resistance protein
LNLTHPAREVEGNAPSSTNRPSIYPILAVNFVGTLGFSIVLPFLVFLVTRWGGNALVYGLMGASYSLFQLVGAPILGRWSDRYGRRKILLLSQLGTLASWLIFLVAFSLPTDPLVTVSSSVLGHFAVTLPLVVMFAARACDGLTGGNVSVANAYLADITDEESRNADFGRMAVSANLGFILGPTIAGALGGTPWGELLPVLAALFISLVASVLIAVELPESKPCILLRDPEQVNVRKVFGQEQKPCFNVQGSDSLTLREILRLERVAPLLAAFFLVMLGFNFYYVSFPVHASQKLLWSVREVGVYFSVLSLSMAVVQGPILSRASKKLSDSMLSTIGSLILAGSFVFFITRQTSLLYAGAVLLALGNGLMWPSIVSMLSKAAGSRHQGAVQGFASSLGAVASIVGLLVGGVLYASLGAWIFLVSSATILGVFVLSVWLWRRGRMAGQKEVR